MTLLDASYRRLFNHRNLLLDLLCTVFSPDVCERLDLDGALPLSPAYVGPAMQVRQGDLAWSVPPRDNDDPILLIGIEHQSQPDYLMALRVGTYKHLQLESFAQQHRPRTPLPIPVMLVLYSGKQAWTASTRSQDLFPALAPPWPIDHIPQQAYWLIDLKKQSLSHSLQASSLFGLICRIQHNQGLAHLSELMQTVLDACPDPNLLRDLAAWINQAILPRCLPNLELPQHLHLKDIRAMLEDNSDSWLHQWEAQGIQKGLAQGLSQGLQRGLQTQQSTLIRQLRRKFGRLPNRYKQQIAKATSRQLTTWSLLLLDAPTVDEVFLPSPAPHKAT